MIIIPKKRIMFLISILCISLFTCSMFVNREEKTVETVALPVTNKVIVIDARTWKAR